MEQLERYLQALSIEVTPEDRTQIDALFPPGTNLSNYYQANFGPNERWA